MSKVRREQPRKDNDTKRINLDNESKDKFDKEYQKRPNTKARNKGRRSSTHSKPTKQGNDVKWYSRNPGMVNASAGSLIFSNTTGQRVNALTSNGQYSIPGVMKLSWVPSFGNADVKALSQAQESIYSYVVHANSRNQSYDSADLMLVIIGVAHLFTWIANGIRAYGLLKRFEGGLNIYTPKTLIEACGFSYSDLKAHQGDMWFYLNQLIAQASQLWVPKNLPFIERWFWLSSNVYMDSESSKGQYYVFAPKNMYKLSGATSTTGTSLDEYTSIPGRTSNNALNNNYEPNLTFNEYVAMMEEVISSFLNLQDRGIMLGDVLKAYGAENIWAISEIPAEYTTPIVHDKEVLMQIENATVMDIATGPITQTANGLLFNPSAMAAPVRTDYAGYLSIARKTLPEYLLLNFHFSGQPTAADVLVATRLTMAGYITTRTGEMFTIYPKTCGTEIVTNLRIYRNVGNATIADNLATCIPTQYDTFKIAYESTYMELKLAALRSQYDWAPFGYVFDDAYTRSVQEVGDKIYPALNGVFIADWVIGDVDNSITITYAELQKLHNTAIYSELGMPML